MLRHHLGIVTLGLRQRPRPGLGADFCVVLGYDLCIMALCLCPGLGRFLCRGLRRATARQSHYCNSRSKQ